MRFMQIVAGLVAAVTPDYPGEILETAEPETTREVFPARKIKRADGSSFVAPAGIEIVPAVTRMRRAVASDYGLGEGWVPWDGVSAPGDIAEV